MKFFHPQKFKKRQVSYAAKYLNWLFLTPCLLTLIICAGWPLIRTISFGFTDATLDNLSDISFVGVDNFIAIARDQDWWKAVLNTFVIAIVSVPLETIFGMVIALILHRNFKGRGWMRAIVSDVEMSFSNCPLLENCNLSQSTSEQMIRGKYLGKKTGNRRNSCC